MLRDLTARASVRPWAMTLSMVSVFTLSLPAPPQLRLRHWQALARPTAGEATEGALAAIALIILPVLGVNIARGIRVIVIGGGPPPVP